MGVSYVDGPRPDVLLNTNGLPIFQYGGTPLSHYETAFYATGGQVIQRANRVSPCNGCCSEVSTITLPTRKR